MSELIQTEPVSPSEAAARLQAICGDRLKLDEPLAPYVTYHIGGPADFLVNADTIEVASQAVVAAREMGLPVLVLSRGSNVLISDRGVRGLVVRMTAAGQRIDEATGEVYAEAGVRLSSLAVATASLGLAGLEFAAGIPGAVGGAVVMNAGCHGNCIGDTLVAATILGTDNQVRRISGEELGIGYRTSRFQSAPDEVVLAAHFQLRHDDASALLARIDQLRKYRQDTQPVEPSAGSTFMKVPVAPPGRLIEEAGLKGTRIGGAMVSPKHANFLVNVGGATAADVLALIRLVQAEVERKHGVHLEREVKLIGDWGDEPLP